MRKSQTFNAKKFWRTRAKARRDLDKKLSSLPYAEKLAIMERMKADHEALQKAKRLT